MSNIYLTLGGVTFQDFEVPERITFGGRQRAAVHELIGGGRVVDVLGGQPAEIVFSGIVSGADASSRAQSLEAACAAGLVLPLGWDAFYYNVVIGEFVADFKKSYWIPFEICCLVIADITTVAASLPVAAASLVSADLSTASLWAAQAGLAGQVFTAAGAAAANRACSSAVSEVGVSVLNATAVINGSVTPFASVNALNALGQNAAALAAASYASGYLSRAVQNLSLDA
jgi:hypothetical protein